MSYVNIYVVDASKPDVVMWLDSALTRGDVGIKGVDDMVTKIVKRCANGDKIAELRIIGHGNEDGQYIGGDWLNLETLEKHKRRLFKLSNFFGKDGHVVLGGCKVGQNGGLLVQLSDILNVPVTAFTASQRPLIPGDEGGAVTCFITCTRTGKQGFDYIDN